MVRPNYASSKVFFFMKTYWLGAAAAAALAIAAQPAAAFERAHAGLLQTETAGGGGAGPQLSEAPRMGTWGFDISGMDRAVEPGDDFFQFSNGTYLKKMEIPSDRSRFGVFDALNELSVNRMRAVLDKAVANQAAAGEEAQIAAMYRSFMYGSAVNGALSFILQNREMEKSARWDASREAIDTLMDVIAATRSVERGSS